MVSHAPIQKANMMYLSKEATNKDQTLKMQMLLSSNDKELQTLKKYDQEMVFLVTKRVNSQFTKLIFLKIHSYIVIRGLS